MRKDYLIIIVWILALGPGGVLSAQIVGGCGGLSMDVKNAQLGETVCLSVRAQALQGIQGLQYAHRYDPTQLELVAIQPQAGLPELKVENFHEPRAGYLKFAWNSTTPISGPDVELYQLCFKRLQAGEAAVHFADDSFVGGKELVNENGKAVAAYWTQDGGLVDSEAESYPALQQLCIEGLNCSSQTGLVIAEGASSESLTYEWAGPEGFIGQGENLSELSAGDYHLALRNSSGLLRQVHLRVPKAIDLEVQLAIDADECLGEADGRITGSVTGGSGLYSYAWSNGADNLDQPTIEGGIYTLTVTDLTYGCTATKVAIVPATEVITTNVSIDPADCVDSNSGAIDLTAFVLPQYEPLQFVWSNQAVTEDISGLAPGTYSVTITAANGCVSLREFEVTVDSFPLTVTPSIQPAGCGDQADGSIKLVVEPSGDYRFSWSNGDEGPEITGLSAGSYQVTITTADGACSWTEDFQLPQRQLAVSSTIDCQSYPDLQLADLTVRVLSGGEEPYQFAWSTGEVAVHQRIARITAPADGVYAVTITSADGCTTVLSDLSPDCAPNPVSLSLYLSPESSEMEQGDTQCFYVRADNFNAIAGMQFSISWDPALLAFASVTPLQLADEGYFNSSPALTATGHLNFVWLDSQLDQGTTLMNGDTLFGVCLTAGGAVGVADVKISSDPVPVEITDVEGNFLRAALRPAVVKLNGGTLAGRLRMGLDTVTTSGQKVCLPLRVSGFQGVTAAQFTLAWDPDKLRFDRLETLEVPDFEPFAISSLQQIVEEGYLRFLWFDDSGGSVILPDGQQILEVCFNVLGGPGDYPVVITPDRLPPLALDADLNPYEIAVAPGLVRVTDGLRRDTIILDIGALATEPGAISCLPAVVDDFDEILSLQFGLSWDDALARFSHIERNEALTQLAELRFVPPAANGLLGVSWNDENLQGVSLPPRTELFKICLETEAVEGATPVLVSQFGGSLEIVGIDNQQRVVVPRHGRLTVTEDELVWPGDTDKDGLADHFDLLPLGLGFVDEGAARFRPTTDWLPQYAEPWPLATPAGQVNFRHSDTDGDGRLGAGDTLAIHRNWTLRHPFGRPTGGPRGPLTPDGYPLYLVVDTLLAGQAYRLPIILGEAETPLPAAYGLAFSIVYDPAAVRPASVWAEFTTSWLGRLGEDLLAIYRNFPDENRIDIALTRIDGRNVSGSGPIAELNITLEDVIFRRTLLEEVPFTIENVRLIDYSETDIPLSPRTTVGVVADVTSTEEAPALRVLSVSPNPASRVLRLQHPGLLLKRLDLLDANGRWLKTLPTSGQLDVSALPTGSYWLQVDTDQGVAFRQFIKQ